MRVMLSAFVLITSVLVVAAQVSTPNIEGNWLGTLEVGGVKLRILLKIQKSANGYAAKFDSLDQGANDLPVDSIVLDGNKLTFSAEKFDINYEGTLNEAGDEITGTFKQGTNSFPLVFKRTTEAVKLNRPQEPKKPYPYDEEEVSYRNEKDPSSTICSKRARPVYRRNTDRLKKRCLRKS